MTSSQANEIMRREKISRALTGRTFSEDHKRKISDSAKGRICSEGTRKKMSEAHRGEKCYWWGKHLSKETKQKISQSNTGHPSPRKGVKLSLKIRRQISDTLKGRKLSPEHIHAISEGHKGQIPWMKGKHHTTEAKKKISKASKKSIKEAWKREDYRERNIKAVLAKLRERPTSYERKIINLIKKYHLPFRYVGNGSLIVAGRNPDFVETNGRKILIEVYEETYWHPPDYEVKRGGLFAKFGFKTIFINGRDLSRGDWEQHCLNKIEGVENGG